MKTATRVVIVIACVLSLPAVGKATDDVGETRMGLTVELEDGSRIRGSVRFDNLHLTSPAIGGVEVPLNQVERIDFRDNRETQREFLRNGDVLTGALAISEIEMETIFGKIVVPLKVVVSMESSALGNLVAHYTFNGNACDASGNAIDGTVYGAKLCEDRYENQDSAYALDGVDDYIKFEQDLPDMKEMTVCAWVFAENDVAFLSDGDWNLHNDVTIHVGPRSVMVRADKGGYDLYDKLDVGTEMQHRWRHIAWTMTSEKSDIYVDGTHRASVENGGSNVGFHNLMLGTMEYPQGRVGWDGYWKGTISSLRIYSRVLSGEEIREIHDLDE